MKKLLTLINLFLLIGAFYNVKASEVIEYDFTVTDGYGYDLETGKYEENINLSSTSKILLSASNSGNEINFNSLDLHHLLFFDKYNKYIGYMNGDGTDLENAKYLGDVAYVTNYPSNAHMFAIVNYNYEETRDLVFLTNPTIDDIAWEDLTYRDIFEGTDLITNGDFNDTTPTTVNTRNVFNYVDAVADNTEITLTTYDSRDVMYYYHDSTANNIRIMEGDFTATTQYTITLDLYAVTNSMTLFLYYTDSTYDSFVFSSGYWDSLEFTTDSGKTVDYIRPYYVVNPTDVYIDINVMQIETGTLATEFVAYEITLDLADNWTGDNIPVIDGALTFSGYGTLQYSRNDLGITLPLNSTIYVSYEIISNDISANTFWINGLSSHNYDGGTTFSGQTVGRYSFIDTVDFSVTTTWFDLFINTNVVSGSIGFDNIMLYDLYSIGFDSMPTTTEFETMKDFYDLYINAPEEITYNDVFTNNLVINGTFDTNISSWAAGAVTPIWDNGTLYLYHTSGLSVYNDGVSIITGNTYYVSVDYEVHAELYQIRVYNGVSYENLSDVLISGSLDLSMNFIALADTTRLYFYHSTSATGGHLVDINLDNAWLLNSTAIFGSNLEPDTTYIEDLYTIWLDPVGDNYLVYYDTTDLDVLVIDYTNDPGVPVEPDIDTGLDSFLDNINMNNTGGKVGLGIITMIFLAIIIGLLTKSTPVVLIVMTVSFITFTVIGWFSIWITIVILIVIVIIGLFSLNRRV